MSTSDQTEISELDHTDVHTYLDRYGLFKGIWQFWHDHSPYSLRSVLLTLLMGVLLILSFRSWLTSMGIDSPLTNIGAITLTIIVKANL